MRNIVAIFAFIQCCYAETVINSAEEFQHFVYEAGWRANAEYCANHDKDKWYNDKVYKDSIYKVIPQAIADCMQKKAEFSNVVDIVTFEANDYTKYSDENWNAVVLWNYLEYAIHNGGALSNDGVDKVGKKLKTYYAQDYWDYINKAVSDIQTYAKDLSLYDYIMETKENTKNNKFYTITKEFDTSSKNAEITLKVCNKTIYIQNGREEYTVPTSVNQIHALPNFAHIYNEKQIDISANKCWFNSVMLNLYNSETFHKVINELQSKSHDKTMPSYWIKQIFNDIRTGDTTKYGKHLKELITAIQAVALTQAIKTASEEIVAPINSDSQEASDTAYYLIVDSLKLEGKIKGINAHSKWEISYEDEAGVTKILNRVYVYSGETDVNAALDDTIYSHDEILIKEDGKEEREHKKLKNQNLPKLLVFSRAEELNKDPLRTPSILDLEAKDGMHRYRLIGVVEEDPEFVNHFEAQVKIEEKWYRVNDLRNPRVEQIPFEESSSLRQMAFYEEDE